jgi:hypothetical protein
LSERRALIIGLLSTVGDIEVLEQVQAELSVAGIAYDVAPYKPRIRVGNPAWLDARTADPDAYTHLIVVCGPFTQTMFHKERDLFNRFAHCVWVGVNLSMLDPLASFNPFDALIERDSDAISRPDLSLLHRSERVPVVGICLAGTQPEYGSRQDHHLAEEKIRSLLKRRNVAVLELDTKWPQARNSAGIANVAQFESLCARVDVLATTRLHGMVLALKNGVPVVAVDAVIGGDKVTRQAEVLHWPEVFAVDAVSDAELDLALDRCLAASAKKAALDCAEAARTVLSDFSTQFAGALAASAGDRHQSALARKLSDMRSRWILLNQRRKERRRSR